MPDSIRLLLLSYHWIIYGGVPPTIDARAVPVELPEQIGVVPTIDTET